MRTNVFQVPDRDLQVLVTTYDDDRQTIAFRPGHGSWGPPVRSMSDTPAEQFMADEDVEIPVSGSDHPLTVKGDHPIAFIPDEGEPVVLDENEWERP